MDPEVVDAIARAALDPASFFNRTGNILFHGSGSTHAGDGLLIPKVEVEVLNEIAKAILSFNHLQHGEWNFTGAGTRGPRPNI